MAMNLLHLFRQSDRPARRLQVRRRPLVEGLEGRQLLSTVGGAEFRMNPASPKVAGGNGQVIDIGILKCPEVAQGNHISTSVMSEQGSHHGNNGVADIQGAHIGTGAMVVYMQYK
jgi:hypothetical protein